VTRGGRRRTAPSADRTAGGALTRELKTNAHAPTTSGGRSRPREPAVSQRRRLALPLAAVLASAAAAAPASALEFEPFPGSPLSVAAPSDVEVLDLDRDGDVEVVVASESGNEVRVFARDGSGGFAFSHTGLAPVGPRQIAFGDLILDDGFADLVAAGANEFTTTTNFGATFGNVGHALPPELSDVRGLELADVTGDARPEAIVLDGAAPAVFAYERDRASGVWTQVADVPTHADPRDLAIGDFDGDGRTDLVVGTNDQSRLTVAFGAAGGGFGAPITVQPQGGYGPWSVATGDFDGDGNDDIAATQRGANSLSILRSDGAGGFTQIADAVVGAGPDGLAAGDLTGDGRVDLATLPGYRGELTLTLGDGRGGFEVARNGRRGLSGQPDVTLADLDGDGLDDVILRYGSGQVELLRNATRAAAATTPPTLSGVGEVGATLTCDPGVWTGSEPLTTSIGWLRDGTPIAGETGLTYVVGEADRGTTVTCAETGVNELPAVTVAAGGVAVPGLEQPPTEEPPTEQPPVDPPAPGPVTVVPGAPAIGSGPASIGRERSVTLTFSGDGTFVCRLDDGPWSACSSPHTFENLRAGDHTAAVRAIGADGTGGPASAVEFQVNPYAPGVRVREARLRAARGVVPLRVTCSALEGAGRGACRGTVELRTGGSGPRTLARGFFDAGAGRTATVRLALTKPGRRALRAAAGRPLRLRAVVRARDLAGNRGTVSRRVVVR